MRFKFTGANRKVVVIMSEGDEIHATHPRTIRMLQRHVNFQDAPALKKRGPKKKKEKPEIIEDDPFSPEALEAAFLEDAMVQTEMDI